MLLRVWYNYYNHICPLKFYQMKVVQFITTAILLFNSAVAFTQATFKGTLNDKSTRQKLSGAAVSLTSSTGVILHTVTDEDGEFRFKDLNEGDYTLEINYVGFTSYVQQLHAGNKKTELKISLIENAR